MASPIVPGSGTKSTKAPGEAQTQSGKTKSSRGISDKDGWAEFNGYMNAKRSKLDEQFNQEKRGHNSNIFSGVAIYVNGYTNPSSDELRRMMQQNGGRYEMYLSMSRVTHVVATNLPNSKFRLTRSLPVVRPEWVVDSVAAGRRLPHVAYLLIDNKSKLQPGWKAAPASVGIHLHKEQIKHVDERGKHVDERGKHAIVHRQHVDGQDRHVDEHGKHVDGQEKHSIGQEKHAIGQEKHAIGQEKHAIGQEKHAIGQGQHVDGQGRHVDACKPEQDLNCNVKTLHESDEIDVEQAGVQSLAGERSEPPLVFLKSDRDSRTYRPLHASNNEHTSCFDSKLDDDGVAVKDGHVAAVKDGHGVAVKDGHGVAVKDGHVAAVKDGHGAAVKDGHVAAVKDGHVAAVKDDNGAAVKDDIEEDDIIYNSEEDDVPPKSAIGLLLQSDTSPNKRRSRVYSLRMNHSPISFNKDSSRNDGVIIDRPNLDLSDRKLPAASPLTRQEVQLATSATDRLTKRDSEFDVVVSNSSNSHRATTSIITDSRPSTVTSSSLPRHIDLPARPSTVTSSSLPRPIDLPARPSTVTSSSLPRPIDLPARPSTVTSSSLPRPIDLPARPSTVTWSSLPGHIDLPGASLAVQNTKCDNPQYLPTLKSSDVRTLIPSNISTSISSGVLTSVSSEVPTLISSDVPTLISSDVPTLISSDVPTSKSSDGPAKASGIPTSISSDCPTILSDGPTISSDGPTISSDGPTISSDGPTISSDGPTITSDGPAISSDGPTLSMHRSLLKQTHQSSSSTMAKAGDTNFLTEFYSNSRLHHIATWGAGLKAYVSQMQKSHDHSYPGREKLRQAHVEKTLKAGQSETLSSARLEEGEKTVMHIDMDCFFVSVGLLSRPELKGKPVAVTHSRGQSSKPNPESNEAWERSEWMKKRNGKLKGTKSYSPVFEDVEMDDTSETCNAPNDRFNGSSTGTNASSIGTNASSTGTHAFHSMAEIASCSYEARKAGVRNGMFMGSAMKLCPNLQTMPYDFDEYSRVSKVLYDVVASYTHDIEAVSCDEMLIDCCDVLADTGATALEFAQVLRAEMWERTGCPASAGIGPNLLLARLATRRAKPNGQFEVSSVEARDFIKDQAVSDLPGVGYSMSRKLAQLGVHTCGDLQNIPLSRLRKEFGPKTGSMLHGFCLGQDARVIQGNKQRKSVSAEVNYGIRFTKEPEAVTFLQDLSLEVKKRMDAIEVKGRSITLKLMVRRPDAPVETAKFMGHGICNTFNKSSNLLLATSDHKVIAREVVSLYRAQRVAAPDIRGVGIQVNKLERTGAITAAGTQTAPIGHQSILHFAVPKTPGSSTTTSATNRTNSVAMPTAASLGSEFRPITEARTWHTPFVLASSYDSVLAECSLKNVSGEAVEPFTFLKNIGKESTMFVNLKHNDEVRADNSTRFPSPSLKHDLTEKCPSQTGPLAKQARLDSAKGLSKQGRASGAAGQSAAGHATPLVTARSSYKVSGRSRQAGDDADASFLTESQIDSDVLQELPMDIAQEILEDVRLRKQQKQTQAYASVSSSEFTPKDNAGSELQGKLTSLCGADTELSAGLPSLSQLDLACFSALPLNLQHELRTAYARKEATSQAAVDKMAALTDGDNSWTSPLKQNKGKQPKTLTRKGRAPGKKVLTFGTSRVKGGSSDNRPMNSKTPASSSVVIICDDDVGGAGGGGASDVTGRFADDGSRDGPRVASETLLPEDNQKKGKEPDKDLMFCGVVGLEDVRNLMKEWLLSCPEPQDDDVAMVTEYLVKLVQLRNLEQVFCLLKFLTRRVSSSQASPQWTDCVSNITACVQSVLLALYGAGFKL